MDTYSYISENGTVRQIEDLLAKAKNEEQDAEITSLRSRVSAVEQEVQKPNVGTTSTVRKYVYQESPIVFTANRTGFLTVRVFKAQEGFTVTLKVNGVSVDWIPYHGTTIDGETLDFPVLGSVLTAWVKSGDVVRIESDQSQSIAVKPWYVMGYNIQYVV